MHLKKQFTLACIITGIASLGGLLFGFNTGHIAGALLYITEAFGLSAFEQSLLVSIVLFTAMIGAGVGGVLSDTFGRKWVMIVSALFFILGSWVLEQSEVFNSLLIGRAILGIALGISSVAIPIYIAEIAPAHHRGAFVVTYQLAITLGILLAYIVNYVYSESGDWKTMLSLGLYPAMIFFFGVLAIPESPRWLLFKNRVQDAQKALRKLNIQAYVQEPLMTHSASLWKVLSSKENHGVLLIGIVLSAVLQLTGINSIIFYTPNIFSLAGFNTNKAAIFATISIGLINFLATIASMWLLDRIGRRKLLIISLCGMCASLFSLGLFFLAPIGLPKVISILSLMSFIVFFAMGIGPVVWVLISEIYPKEIRGIAVSLSLLTNWFCNCLVSMSFLHLTKWLSVGGAFLVYAFIAILGILFAVRKVPETKGKTLEEIENFLQKS